MYINIILMGAKNESRTSIRNKIQTEISNTVQNITENISNIVNKTTNETLIGMIQEMKADVKISNNKLKSNKITAIGASNDVDAIINQDIEVENLAIIKIISDASAMAKLADKISSDVTNRLSNDSAGKASISQLAAIADVQKQMGGPEQMVDSIMKTVDGMIGGGSNEEDIKNKIKTDILNKTTNRNDIQNIIKNKIQNSIQQAAQAQCNIELNSNNTLDVDSIVAAAIAGQRNNIKVKQTVSLKAFIKCFTDLKMGEGIVNDIGIDRSFTDKNLNKNTQGNDTIDVDNLVAMAQKDNIKVTPFGGNIVMADQKDKIKVTQNTGLNENSIKAISDIVINYLKENPIKCTPDESKSFNKSIYQFFEIEASYGENIDPQFKNNLLPLIEFNSINKIVNIKSQLFKSPFFANIDIDIKNKFPNKVPLVTLKITNIKNKNMKESNPVTISSKEPNGKLDADNIAAIGQGEDVTGLNIDFTNFIEFKYKQMVASKFKSITLTNMSLTFLFDHDLTLTPDVFNLSSQIKSTFENVSGSDSSSYFLLIFAIILLIAFLNRERLMKMIKG